MKSYFYYLFLLRNIGAEIYREGTRQKRLYEVEKTVFDANQISEYIYVCFLWHLSKKGSFYWEKMYKKFNLIYSLPVEKAFNFKKRNDSQNSLADLIFY